jgi:hypothetical protein
MRLGSGAAAEAMVESPMSTLPDACCCAKLRSAPSLDSLVAELGRSLDDRSQCDPDRGWVE